MRKYGEDLGENTQIEVDDDLVQMEVEGAERIPFTMTAEALGRRIVANIVMLGYIANKFDLVPRKYMEKSILQRIPKGTEELNKNAFQAGWDLADGKKPKIPKKKDGKKDKKKDKKSDKRPKAKGKKKGGGK
jgi:2-oxoglutarate ferredoxin oxidoreductase subunit gamma